MGYWAQAPISRHQAVLFAPTLDETISPDHSVRLVSEMLEACDFSDWESHYCQVAGQPAIHPRVMAGATLYGLSLGIRSSRRLEDATVNRLDFLWLCQGRRIDHATFSDFRTRFAPQIKDLFKQVVNLARGMGLVRLNQVALDGTAVRSNNSTGNTARRDNLEQKLAALDEQVTQMLAAWEATDRKEDDLYGAESSAAPLPRDLADLKKRQATMRRALEQLKELEEKRRGRKDLSAKGPSIPLADPDSRMLPNKHGGQAPDYTAVLATDGQAGLIVHTQAIGGNDEAATVLPAVEQIEEDFGQAPGQLLTDGNFNSGPNLAELEQQKVEALMPARQPFRNNPAQRADATQPVPPEQWDKLPVSPQQKVLDKAAFVYDSQSDQYRCPMGRALMFVGTQAYCRDKVKGTYRVYQCGTCGDCPLAAKCLRSGQSVRRLCRDEYEPARERLKRRMDSAEGKAAYTRRSWIAETPFAVWRTVMNFRQFLLRGLAKVQTELDWTATAYNLRKLMRHQRRQAAATPVPGG